MVDLDIDIWGRGRDAAAAGRLTLRMLKACYPYVGPIDDTGLWLRLTKAVAEQFERNYNDQRVWMLKERHIFFQNKEDAEICRALQYLI